MKKISIIIPCFNEEAFIESVLQNAFDQDYPAEHMEIIVVDGNSTDKTKSIVQKIAETKPHIRLIDNPDRFAPYAFNRGIRASFGEVIYIWGAHSAYPSFYISRLLDWLEKSGSDNVGGLMKTQARSNSLSAIAIAKVLAHPLGVGNSSFRTGIKEAREADTVPFGCYRRDVFERFGYFDERLIRNQDIEHNRRIKRLGGKLLLVPDVYLTYFARATYGQLWSNNFGNGEWVVRAAQYTGTLDALSLRHFIPMGFVAYLLDLILWGFLSYMTWVPVWIFYLLLVPIVFYGIGISIVSLQISWQEKKPALFFHCLLAFLVLHVSYGLGSWTGFKHTFFNKEA